MKNATIKITRDVFTTGDRYARIHPHSRKRREYGIEIDGELMFRNGTWCTLRGVKLAVLALKTGATANQLNFFNADDCATRIANNRPELRKELTEKIINEVCSSKR